MWLKVKYKFKIFPHPLLKSIHVHLSEEVVVVSFAYARTLFNNIILFVVCSMCTCAKLSAAASRSLRKLTFLRSMVFTILCIWDIQLTFDW